MKASRIRFLLFFLVLFYANFVYAHISVENTSFVSANAHIRFANKGSVPVTQPWQIPGTLMGGEALPVEKGLDLEDIQLYGVWFPKQDSKLNYSVEGRLSSHHDGEVSAENFFINHYASETLTLSAGKMDARFSKNARWHAFSDIFSEAPLNASVFFGGHFTDSGIRANKKIQNFNVGIELWNGDAWPAGSGEYSADVYLHHSRKFGAINIASGLWNFYAQADMRNDSRYSEGHSHGNVISNSSNFFFSGREKMTGVFINIDLNVSENSLLGLNSEFIAKESEGNLNDSTRVVDMRGKHLGYITTVYFSQNDITYAIRREEMSFDNEFSGAAATFLSQDAGLVNDDFEPSRTHFSISKQMDVFTLRAEAVKDKSVDNDGVSRFSASLIWQDRLWTKQ